jgi:Protein of unknown function DUF2625
VKTLAELTQCDDPAIADVRKWAVEAPFEIEFLAPADDRDRVLMEAQVTTRSVLGALAHETGGILVDGGWLRLLGSGHPRLTRSLPTWNKGKSDGFYLVGDDAAGGVYAINGNGLGTDFRKMYYLAPDNLRWEAMNIEFSQFVQWAMTERLSAYYESLRWDGWRDDVKALHGDRCFWWYPPLWTLPDGARDRGEILIEEAWDLSRDFKRQLGDA